MPRCRIALGGNTGPVEKTFRRALQELDSHPRVCVTRISKVHRSRPVGEHSGGEFRNAAAEVETDLEPLDLLDVLQSIEVDHGRTREIRWGPRTLDLDLVLYGERVIDDPRLRVPHPACWYRRFVLDPLVEIAADVVHPEKGVTFGALRTRLLERSLPVALAGGDAEHRKQLVARLAPDFPQVRFQQWESRMSGARPDPALILWLGTSESESAAAAPEFESLPPLPRLDASGAESLDDLASFARDVLRSALGE